MGYFYSDDYLAHHGIKGQRWGVRRFQRPDGTRTAAGKARAKENSLANAQNEPRKGFTDQQKQIMKIGAGLVAAGLVVYGAYKVSDIANVNGNIIKPNKDYLQMKDYEKNLLIGLINSGNGKYNCQTCTAMYDLLRKTGQTFSVNPFTNNTFTPNNLFMNKLYKDFPGFKTSFPADSCTEFAQQLVKSCGSGDNVFGRLNIKNTTGGLHAVSFYMQNGKPRIVESQNKVDLSVEDFDRFFGKYFDWNIVEYARTDNLEFKEDAIEYLKSMARAT